MDIYFYRLNKTDSEYDITEKTGKENLILGIVLDLFQGFECQGNKLILQKLARLEVANIFKLRGFKTIFEGLKAS